MLVVKVASGYRGPGQPEWRSQAGLRSVLVLRERSWGVDAPAASPLATSLRLKLKSPSAEGCIWITIKYLVQWTDPQGIEGDERLFDVSVGLYLWRRSLSKLGDKSVFHGLLNFCEMPKPCGIGTNGVFHK